jgi:transposase
MNKNRLKVKTAFEVIEERHGIKGKSSINTFRRFVRDKGIKESKPQITCRIEVAPGEEIQIDYCKVGKARDKESGKDRSVYAFMSNLSHSRNKYIEYVYKQDTRSFVSSHVKMFKYFGGVPKRILIDNLTSGIIKADLYDPRLNHSYQEMAEHYGVFIDPCRVRHPKDKGKVERDVQTVREQYRKMQALNPDIDIQEANQIMVRYLKEEYGQREHGTTRLKPYEVFKNVEQPALKKLPDEDFEIAEWKEAGVHPDCYIQFNKRAYSVPYTYAGKKVWVKGTEKLIQIYYNDIMIKQHTITSNYRSTDFADFPKNVSAALDSGLHRHLITKSEKIGTNFHKMILNTLTPHAFMNLRRAQGIVGLSEKYDSEIIEKASEIVLIQNRYVTPKSFKVIVDKLIEQNGGSETVIQFSEESKSYVRQIDYFVHNNIFNMEN